MSRQSQHRRNPIHFFVLGLLAGCLMSGTVVQAAPAQLPPMTLDGSVSQVYKTVGGTSLRLYIFNPPNHRASDRTPALVLFFGGGWTNGAPENLSRQARYLASRGMVAVLPDYRVYDRQKTTPFEAMMDAKSAIRWVRSRAASLGIDPGRVAAGGASAGGQLALSAAIFDDFDEAGEDRRTSARPSALVLFNPAVDTTYKSLKVRFGERGKEASPAHHLHGGLPPMLILHGKIDFSVPYSDARKFCERAKELDNRCKLVGYTAAPHGFYNAPAMQGKWYRETLLEVDRFLTRLGYLAGPSPKEIKP